MHALAECKISTRKVNGAGRHFHGKFGGILGIVVPFVYGPLHVIYCPGRLKEVQELFHVAFPSDQEKNDIVSAIQARSPMGVVMIIGVFWKFGKSGINGDVGVVQGSGGGDGFRECHNNWEVLIVMS